MKKLTHLQWFKDLNNFVKGYILRNSLECLHTLLLVFFSAIVFQYKQLKREFTFLMNLIMKSKISEVRKYFITDKQFSH